MATQLKFSSKRLVFCIFISVFTCSIFIYYKSVYMFNEEMQEEILLSSASSKYLLKTKSCEIVNIEPYDKSIESYIKPGKPFICADKSPLTYVVKLEGKNVKPKYVLTINTTVIPEYTSDNKIQCCLSVITRAKADNNYTATSCKTFQQEYQLEDNVEFISVQCTSSEKKEIYKNMHSVVPVKTEVTHKLDKINNDGQERLSVLLLGIDAMSRSNIVRTIPKTESLLKQKEWVQLQTYHKVGDNTVPNLLGLFTGYDHETLAKKKICEPNKNKFDSCPFIWKKFSDDGYVTMYAEDRTIIATFRGFSKQPTDYYLKPYMIAAEKLPVRSNQSNVLCLGPRSATDHVLDYVSTFLDVFQDNPFFAHVWLNSFSHDDHNIPSNVDQLLLNFFKSIMETDVMNNTMILFLSDHGQRFGEIRSTYVGWLENNLPFIYIWLPPWFRRRYPHAYNNLQANSERLITPFDIHMTLRSVLEKNYMKKPLKEKESGTCKSCVSLFTEVVGDRSCDDVGINSDFCSCSGYKDVSLNSEIVQTVVLHAISHINNMFELKKSKISAGKKCAVLSLSEVLTVRRKVNMLEQDLIFHEYLMVFRTAPSKALFEARVKYFISGKFEIVGAVKRINSYGNQSICANDGDLKLYCFCV